jgi:hypothetical protein
MDYPTNITNAAHRAQYDDIYRAAVEQVVDTVRQAFPQVEIDVRAITNPLDAAQLWYVAITFTWRAGPWVAPQVAIYGHELIDEGVRISDIVEHTLTAIARRMPDRLPPQE